MTWAWFLVGDFCSVLHPWPINFNLNIESEVRAGVDILDVAFDHTSHIVQRALLPSLPPPFRYHNPELCYPRKFWNISVNRDSYGFFLEQKPSCFCYQNEMISLNKWVMIWCINQQLNHLFQGKYTILQLVKKKTTNSYKVKYILFQRR